MAQSGVFIFGCLVLLGGVIILLLRKFLGRFAHDYWSAIGSKRGAKTERYWVDYSLATGGVVAAVGVVIALVGAFGKGS